MRPGSYRQIDSPQDVGERVGDVFYDPWIRLMPPLMGLLAVTSLVMAGIAASLE